MALRRTAVAAEQAWDGARRLRWRGRAPAELRIVSYLGHGGPSTAEIRCRVLAGANPPEARAGEGPIAAARRTAARCLTDEVADVPLRFGLGESTAQTVTDSDGYAHVTMPRPAGLSDDPWSTATIELVTPWRGRDRPLSAEAGVRLPRNRARLAVVSDLDDTVLVSGTQQAWRMAYRTIAGSALTRDTFPGTPELYRSLARGRSGDADNPVFYVSSSPWNLYGLLTGFLAHRGFPAGPLLLRDLLGSGAPHTNAVTKLAAITEVLETHPELAVLLIGDSGQQDAEIYAEVARQHPDRVVGVWVRELQPGTADDRVARARRSMPAGIPFVVATDAVGWARDGAAAGLLTAADVVAVQRAAQAG